MEVQLVAVDADVVRLRCRGSISHTAPLGEVDPLARLLGPEGYGRKIIVDLSAADRVDSSGIGWLAACHHRALKAGGALGLYNVPPLLSQVFRFCKLDHLLTIRTDEADALAWAKNGS
jgi:anti-anti-sigma factor